MHVIMTHLEKIYVKKLWGENAAELYQSTLNIIEDAKQEKSQIIVLSAMRSEDFNTTDVLIQIGDVLEQWWDDVSKLPNLLTSIYEFHKDLIDIKLEGSGIDTKHVHKILDTEFQYFEESISEALLTDDSEFSKENDYSCIWKNGETLSILGFWEKLSSLIFTEVMNQASQTSETYESIYAGDICDHSELQNMDQSEIFEYISQKLAVQLWNIIDTWKIPIVSGYIWTLDWGIEQSIGRGYTDATAAMIAVWMANMWRDAVLEIQKSVRGVLSADPRVLRNPHFAKVLSRLDYITAREITGDNGASAKLLHSQAIRREVQDAGVKIHIYNPFTSGEEGTWILPTLVWEKKDNTSLFVGGRKNILFFSVSSGKMFDAWILASVFERVQKYAPVDIVATSETEISFTIDRSHLELQSDIDGMEQELRDILEIPLNTDMESVDYRDSNALLFCIDPYMKNKVWYLAKITWILAENDINIEIVSQWRLQRNIVFWIAESDLEKAINLIHEFQYSE